MAIEGLSPAAAAIAFVGGLVSCVSPCVLPLVPVYLGHLSGASVRGGHVAAGGETFAHALAFVAGFFVVFVALGATAGALGGVAGGQQQVVARIAGALLIATGLYMAGAFRLPGVRRVLAPVNAAADSVFLRERRFQSPQATAGGRPGYWRSLGVGGAFAAGWVPCVTPVLGAILTLGYAGSSQSGGAWAAAGESAALLFFYAAGMALPFLGSGLLLGRITPLFRRLNRLLPAVNVLSGLLLVGVGVLVFNNMVVRLNQYFNFLPYFTF